MLGGGALREVLPDSAKRPLRRAAGNARIVTATLRPQLLPAATLDCVLARNEYGAYCVPRASRHRPAARTVLQARVYERDTIELMRGIPGDIVHAGTFFGDFLPALASSRDEMVWAFEPNRESYRCARITAELNDLQNVSLTNAALSSAPGEAVLATGNRHGVSYGGGSRLITGGPDGRSHEVAQLVTVDEAVPEDRHVGVLQLDVEGHEEQALAGALLTIERCRPLLILESLPASEWLDAQLPGYIVTGRVNGNAVLEAT
jgi:FkbM family methyltransferase